MYNDKQENTHLYFFIARAVLLAEDVRAVRNKGEVFPLPSLPSPSSLRDATSPKVRGLGSPPKIAGHLVLRQTFTAFSRDFTGKEL